MATNVQFWGERRRAWPAARCPLSRMPRQKADGQLSAEIGQQNRVGVQPLNVCFGRQSRPRVPIAREPLSAQLQLRRGYQVLGGYH